MRSEWDQICDYLLYDEDCEPVHKMVWRSAEEAWLTYPSGLRICVTVKYSLETVKKIVAEMRFNLSLGHVRKG